MLLLCKDKEDGDGSKRTNHDNYMSDTNHNIFQWEEERLMYKDKKWLRKRQSILRRDSYLCRECKRYGKTSSADTVHHIIPVEMSSELVYDNNNLISLCNSCHNAMHYRETRTLTVKGMRWVSWLLKKWSTNPKYQAIWGESGAENPNAPLF